MGSIQHSTKAGAYRADFIPQTLGLTWSVQGDLPECRPWKASQRTSGAELGQVIPCPGTIRRCSERAADNSSLIRDAQWKKDEAIAECYHASSRIDRCMIVPGGDQDVNQKVVEG